MLKPLNLLIIEDSEDDAHLVLLELQRLGYEVEMERVETTEAMRSALKEKTWDLILSDYSMPAFNAPQALEVLNASGFDLPFIIISGTIGEETAVAALKAGANDFFVKGKFARLGPAIERELREVESRRERKLAEERLRYQAYLLSNVKDAIIATDENYRITYWNEAAESLYGWLAEEIIGKQGPEITQTEFPNADNDEMQRYVRDKGFWRGEVTQIKKDGARFSCEIASLLLQDEKGAVIGYVSLNHNITERKQAEEQIQRQLKRLNALRMIDIALISSFDLHVILDVVLQQVLSQLGADASAVLLVTPHLRTMEYGASQGFRSSAIQHIQLKSSEGYAARVVTERGTVHVMDLIGIGGELTKAPHLADEGFVDYYGIPLIVKGEVKGVLEIYHRAPLNLGPEQLEFLETLAGQAAIAIDNSQLFQNLQRANAKLEQRVAERTAELNRTNLELERANRAKDEFLATMSHELRTPLNSVLGLSESLLEETRGLLNDHQKKSLQIIETSGHHLLELINDVLDLSKIEAGKFDFYPQVVDVGTLCRSSLAFVKEQALRKSIDLNYEESKTVSKIYGDPRRLKQILINLLTNAVKFTPERGQVTLQVRSDAERDLIQFSVTDTGIGIANEDLKQLFQPFVQVDSSFTREFEGTGLGLALVQKLTDLHGGSVEVESEVGQGSRFTINLPWGQDRVTQQEAMESGRKVSAGRETKKRKTPSEGSSKHGTVLLAEDNNANVLTIGEYLESHGYQVVIAHDGLEAIEKAEETKPDVILMDIQMPSLDGLEAIRRLRKNPRFASTPIIALTALAMPGDRELCLQAGADEYMSKPVSLKVLVKTIDRLLGRENE